MNKRSKNISNEVRKSDVIFSENSGLVDLTQEEMHAVEGGNWAESLVDFISEIWHKIKN